MQNKTNRAHAIALAIKPDSLLALGWLVALVIAILLTSCAPTNAPSDIPQSDPLTVIRQFTDAMRAGKVNQALALFADDVEFADSDEQVQYGKAFVQQWLTQELPRQQNAELADILISGNTIAWTVRIPAEHQTTLAKSEAIVERGKFTFFSALK